jgi:O-antigen/teichoic acid export membrane protein
MAETRLPALGLTQVLPSRGVSLRANFTWTFFGNAVYSACQWGSLVILAKLGSPELVGQYSLGLAIAMPVIALASLQLRPVIASDVKEEYRFGEYLGFRITTTALAMLVISAIALAMYRGRMMTSLIFLMGFSQALEAISDLYYARLQFIDRMDRIAKSQIIRGPISLLAMGLAVAVTGQVVWGAAALVLARAAVLFGYDLRTRTQCPQPLSPNAEEARTALERLKETLRPRWDWRRFGEILWLSLPLGIVALLVNLNVNIPRYFIQNNFGTRELGLFSSIAFMMSAGNLFVGALAQAAFVRMAKSFAEGNASDFVSVLLKLLGIGTLLGAGGIVLARVAGAELLTILYRPEYAALAPVLVLFMVVAWLSYLSQFLGYAMTSARYFVHQIPLFAIVALSITAGSYWLVPKMGLKGAVLATLVGVTVQLIGSIVILFMGFIKNSRMRAEATKLA